jgi:hypothetical protein
MLEHTHTEMRERERDSRAKERERKRCCRRQCIMVLDSDAEDRSAFAQMLLHHTNLKCLATASGQRYDRDNRGWVMASGVELVSVQGVAEGRRMLALKELSCDTTGESRRRRKEEEEEEGHDRLDGSLSHHPDDHAHFQRTGCGVGHSMHDLVENLLTISDQQQRHRGVFRPAVGKPHVQYVYVCVCVCVRMCVLSVRVVCFNKNPIRSGRMYIFTRRW